uniref:Uncharacterized protein n=1 Tax=Arundo donax TaxID=35708 RepID=A0A0A9AV23_ARUDO
MIWMKATSVHLVCYLEWNKLLQSIGSAVLEILVFAKKFPEPQYYELLTYGFDYNCCRQERQ